MSTPLAGRRALVAGASSGIGAAIAQALAAAGAEVHGVARREKELLAVLGPDAAASGRSHAGDLTDTADLDRVVAEFAARPGDIIVAAAGTNVTDRHSETLTDEGWETVLTLNLAAIGRLVRRVAPALKGTGGDIVLIASVSGAYPDHAGPAYAASKAGLVAFGRGVARDLHGDGVRVTNVLPGICDTPLLDKRPSPPPQEVRRWCMQPTDVAAAVVAAVSLPPRACVAEMTVLATRLQTIGGSQHATPPLPEQALTENPDRFEVSS